MKITNRWRNVLTKLGIGCVICLLLSFGFLLYAQEQTKSESIAVAPKTEETTPAQIKATAKAPAQPQQRNRTWERQNRGGGIDYGENAAFYETIIDYNLFRPLGWTPPKNEPSYSLIGTKIVDSDSATSRATLLESRSNRYHFVTIGTKLDDMTVKDIQAKRVILDKDGEEITLKTGEFQPLTTKGGNERNRGGERGDSGSESARNNNNTGQNQNNQANAQQRNRTGSRERAGFGESRRREMMERMRNASPEERRELIQQFRRRGGGDGVRRSRGRDR